MPDTIDDVPESILKHPAWTRLNDQLNWYDNKSIHNQRLYKIYAITQLVLSILIPPIAVLNSACAPYITAATGAVIAVLQGLQHLFQHSTLWIEYRSTAEHLKHEKFLFLSYAGPYRDLDESDALRFLAERVEEHVSTEHANWVQTATESVKRSAPPQ